jgi:hypothetical protein
MAGGGSKNGDYWPGFVDALTNVVIAMVFVIVVLAIALSFSAQLLAKRLAAKIAEQENELGKARAVVVAPKKTDQERPEPKAPPAVPETPDAQAPVKQRIKVAGNEAALAASAAGGKLKPAEHYLELEFAATALTLDANAAAQLTQGLAPVRQRLNEAASLKVAIVAVGPDIHLSENQRSAFIRAMAVRNHLLEQGIAAPRITTRIDMQSRATTPAVAVRVEDSTP